MVVGAAGQVGRDIVKVLANQIGADRVIATDLSDSKPEVLGDCIYEKLDIREKQRYLDLTKKYKVTTIIQQAAIISALAEKNVDLAYEVNVTGTYNALNVARETGASIFIPTTIGVFGGNNFKKDKTPVVSVQEPNSIYGVTKVFNELLGTYYFQKFGVDFRCLRYPGIISSAKYEGNGTVSYITGKNNNH
jgi:nucleoside-diphosphate-sugar epimerase